MISKQSVIKENTHAHIINGNWNHYFQKDSATGDMLALMFPPSGVECMRLSANTTYEDLHRENQITVSQNSPLTSTKLQLPAYGDNIITLYTDELYTDGDHLLKVDSEITKYLYNSESYNSCMVKMTDAINDTPIDVPLRQLHSQYTLKMSMLLYRKSHTSTGLERGYLNAASKYSQVINKLISVGEMITIINKNDTSFTDYLKNQFEHGKHTGELGMNIVGDDNQYFVQLNSEQTHVEITKTLNRNAKNKLITKLHVSVSVSDFQKIFKKIWFKNYHICYKPENLEKHMWDFYDTMERIIINKLYEHTNNLTKYSFHNMDPIQSRYPYYK